MKDSASETTGGDLFDNSPQTLTTLLREGGVLSDARVSDLEVIPLTLGQTANTERIIPRYDREQEGAPASFIRKFHSDALAEINLGSGGSLKEKYLREFRFYQLIGENSAMKIPRCYGSCLEEKTGRFTLLLEDFGKTCFRQAGAATLEEIAVATQGLAKMHGRTLENPELPDYPWLVKHDDFQAALSERYEKAMETFFERFDSYLSPLRQRLTRQITHAAKPIVNKLTTAPHALVHGDFHQDNMAFFNAPQEIGLVDWQHVGWGCPTIDLTRWFLYANTAQPLDEAQETKLLQDYHLILTRESNCADFPFEQLQELHRFTVLRIWMEISEAYTQMRTEDIEKFTRMDIGSLLNLGTAFMEKSWVADQLDSLAS